jgi:hypothetical protein
LDLPNDVGAFLAFGKVDELASRVCRAGQHVGVALFDRREKCQVGACQKRSDVDQLVYEAVPSSCDSPRNGIQGGLIRFNSSRYPAYFLPMSNVLSKDSHNACDLVLRLSLVRFSRLIGVESAPAMMANMVEKLLNRRQC